MKALIIILLFSVNTALLGANSGAYILQLNSISRSYNCFSDLAYPNIINFSVTKTRNDSATYAVSAGPSENTGTYNRQMASGANRLNYQLYTSPAMNSVLKAPPEANINEVISGLVVAQAPQTIPLVLTVFIPPSQIVAPGTYTDQVTFGVYTTYNDIGAAQDTRTLTLTVIVSSGVALSIVPAGSGFSSSTHQSLDFGELANGQIKSCDLVLHRNTGCIVTLDSANHGVLKLIPATADKIVYTCQCNGALLDLNSSANLNFSSDISTNMNESRMPIAFTIGTVEKASAGKYQDQITITLTIP